MLRVFTKKSVRYGIPFLLFILGGTYGLSEFQALKFRYKPMVEQDIREEAAKLGIQMKKRGEVTIETEYEKMKDKKFDNWENKRIPRPWEEEPSNT
ncbi:cytochrome c oxidase assembly protein COX16 homolog, mitochondrial [Belonocnema kinseyi]|uniref:cytochrome c oxidase assembly protein COX16 homolog, mitochondrial n=1 Tax=Belonocnema kinseyi TaxID=2817044 RepID=UPI00143CDE95|nr:cytochrome c oxidase assembly protein COX16 homolog, mitochondrial [Belonocnema kinseyi]XP_033207977.1 cytochrome c oxidase assembly protein COX16 homolog, mitochondrial [Belonocnema kinseyi]XP_033207978.1 cytochrome c oxidase assembly protein COX16 homolog, mitochondrial [Belonocnema kinseyi]